MNNQKSVTLQKAGGVSAIVHAAAYVVGIVFALTLVAPMLSAETPQYLALLADNLTVMYVWILICYLLAAVSLAICVLALNERLKNDTPILAQVASLFGAVWVALIIASGNLMLYDFGVITDLFSKNPAQAETVWVALQTVENGITSGNEMVGSLWVMLLSIAGLQSGKLSKALSYFGIVIAGSGLITLIPAIHASSIPIIFGLGIIIWSVWVGIVLLRTKAEK